VIKTDAPLFGRLVTAMVTPFADDLTIDHKAVEHLVDHLIATGSDAIVVNGTTGESPTLEDDEKRDLLKTVVSATRGRARVIMGTGYNATAKTVKASKEAEKLGADGLLVVAPYYNKPSQDGLMAHFKAVASATALPFILYNIPGRTGINVNVDTIVQLSHECPTLHALKDSTGNVDQAADIAGKARADFRIYSGDDNMTLPFLSVGACGVISVASHIVGDEVKSMIERFFSGDLDGARELHYRYLPIFKGLFTAPNPTCVKHALNVLGLSKAHLRLPLVPLKADQQAALEKVMKELSIGVKARAQR